MTNRLLLSVAAAALIAGTGFANAQGTGMSRESPSSGSTAQQQPSSGGGAMQNERSGATSPKGAEHSGTKGSESGMKSGDSTDKSQPGAGKSAQEKSEKSKSMSSETESKGSKDMKAEDRDSRDKSGGTAAESRDKDGSTKTQTQTQTKSPTDSRSQTTTGAAGTSATAAPPAEKRTQIVSAIKSERVEEVTNVNFNVAVGTVVPTSVRFHPLPPRIVEIYPEWRGYQFILVKGRYVIVHPQTHEIVYIIEG